MKNNNQTTYKSGDILTSTWGYGQTNVSWYRVEGVSKSGKSITLQEYDYIYHRDEENIMCGHATIDLGTKRGKSFRKVAKEYMRPSDYMGSFEIWDGKPKFISSWN
tara:strand:+ start:180 stop:497 length:318 start_codon:yes stop_codon:yes gene_type:complete